MPACLCPKCHSLTNTAFLRSDQYGPTACYARVDTKNVKWVNGCAYGPPGRAWVVGTQIGLKDATTESLEKDIQHLTENPNG